MRGNKKLVGRSESHRSLLTTLRQVADTDAEVLISGPSGVGKELYARYTHENSHRQRQAFVSVNCGALTPELIENELFGHVAGAFTGAQPRNDGLVAAAQGGTLFLDEVDTLPPTCQIKLLRFIQEKEFRRLGEVRVHKADVRIIAATNADLQKEVQLGNFRADLFFRLRVVPVKVPALNERQDDIEPLVEAFIERYSRRYNLPAPVFSKETKCRLLNYSWPGNIRELENCIRYITCLNHSRAIQPEDLGLLDINLPSARPTFRDKLINQPFQNAKQVIVDNFEKEYITAALTRAGGNVAHAAKASGKHRRAFFELMRKHNITAKDLVLQSCQEAP